MNAPGDDEFETALAVHRRTGMPVWSAVSAGLLARLEPEELEKIGGAMCEIGEIESGKIADAIAGFVTEAEREGLPMHDRQAQVSALMRQAVGPVKG